MSVCVEEQDKGKGMRVRGSNGYSAQRCGGSGDGNSSQSPGDTGLDRP